jgi:hypothetical protein
VNANDKLRLAEMGSRRRLLTVHGGDHTFSSRKQTEQVIEWTVEWAEALRDGRVAQYSCSKLEENRGISTTSIAV